MIQKPCFTTHENRALIHVEGKDRLKFLQSLVSNDVYKLKSGTLLYSCLLTPQGKFLHDLFIHAGEDFLLLDCEGGERAQDLYKRLNMYRLRSDVQLSIQDDVTVYVGWGIPSGLQDPRHPEMGLRSFEKPNNLEKIPFEIWDKNRISLCVPDGSRDLVFEKSTMDEARMDQLNAIDYDKGCYVGQELTARMHYRGLGKKHLKVVTLTDLDTEHFPPAFTPLQKDGKTIGEMRSSSGDMGLALLKDD